MNGVYKTNIDCSLIRRMVGNFCALGKIQSWPTIYLGPTEIGQTSLFLIEVFKKP